MSIKRKMSVASTMSLQGGKEGSILRTFSGKQRTNWMIVQALATSHVTFRNQQNIGFPIEGKDDEQLIPVKHWAWTAKDLQQFEYEPEIINEREFTLNALNDAISKFYHESKKWELDDPEHINPEVEVEEPCNWFHMSGISSQALDSFQRYLGLSKACIEQAKCRALKPCMEWHDASTTKSGLIGCEHMFVVAHKLMLLGPGVGEGIDFKLSQVSFICLPDQNGLISVLCDDCVEPWGSLRALLYNKRTVVRREHHFSDLLVTLIDSMVDEVYPVLDLYGDTLEELDVLMSHSRPSPNHVRSMFYIFSTISIFFRTTFRT